MPVSVTRREQGLGEEVLPEFFKMRARHPYHTNAKHPHTLCVPPAEPNSVEANQIFLVRFNPLSINMAYSSSTPAVSPRQH